MTSPQRGEIYGMAAAGAAPSAGKDAIVSIIRISNPGKKTATCHLVVCLMIIMMVLYVGLVAALFSPLLAADFRGRRHTSAAPVAADFRGP
jgi:hypothetical protein